VPTAIEARQRLEAAAASGGLDALCERLDVDLLGVFGSASGLPGVASDDPHDLDVCVRFARGGRGDLLALIDALTVLTGYERVDVLDLAAAGPVARKEALFGIGLYERDPGAWSVAAMAAFGEWRDTEHLRRMDLEALAE
jgi:hypothetical protein